MVVGKALVILHNNSLLNPNGQNFVNTSTAVKGIEIHKNKSRMARCDMSASLLISLERGCMAIRIFSNDKGSPLLCFLLWTNFSAINKIVLNINPDKVTSEYNPIKM